MGARLFNEVAEYLAEHEDITTAERLVLLLIAYRAHNDTRRAYSGRDGWDLGAASGLKPRRLRQVFAALAERGLEVRQAQGKDGQGRPVFGTWRANCVYELPTLIGGSGVPPTPGPVGGTDVPPTPDVVGGTNRQGRGTGVPPNTMLSTTNTTSTKSVPRRKRRANTADPLTLLPGGTAVRTPKTAAQPGLWPAAVADLAPPGATLALPDDQAAEGTSTCDASPVTARTIVAEWIDRCQATPPKRVIGHTARIVAELLAEGIAPDTIRRGMAHWMAKGLSPATLPSVVNQVMNAGVRPSTTDARVAEALAIGRELQAEADRRAVGA